MKGLSNQGIKVAGVAVLKIPDSKGKEETIDKTVDNILSKMSKEGFPGILEPKEGFNNEAIEMLKVNTQKANQASDPDQCYCPECFNFETFEEVLSKRNGNFDYASVKLGGKQFDIKYWTDGKDENIMISPYKEKVAKELSMEDLQTALNEAVSAKQYDQAQALITRINELKNQKGG